MSLSLLPWRRWASPRGLRLLAALFLFALNLVISWRLLFVHYLPWFNSIEPYFFALAEHIKAHWPHTGWYQCWYAGMPFEYTYPPLLLHATAAASLLARCSVPHAFHICVALFYSLGPVTLYLLVLELSRRLDVAIFAGLCYSLWSPSALLVHNIALDIGGVSHARRLYNAVFYGDSPQMAALTLVPLALLALNWAVRRPGVWSIVVAAVALMSVPLTNIPAALGLAMALIAWILAADKGSARCLLALASSAALGYLLICRWMPPSDLLLTFESIRTREAPLAAGLLLWYAALAVAALVARWGMKRLRLTFAARFALLFCLIVGVIALSGPWFGVHLLEQSDRFHMILEMAVAILAGLALGWLVALSRITKVAVIAAVVVLSAWQFRNYRHFARQIIYDADITSRSEYKVARWMDRNAGGARVLVPGSIRFFLNSLTSTPQMTGCCEQNALSGAEDNAYYQYGADVGTTPQRSAEMNIAWMKALGVGYVATNDANSTEVYHDVRHPYKFDGLLPLRWPAGTGRSRPQCEPSKAGGPLRCAGGPLTDAGDFIYEVPLPSHSLAHAVYADELVSRAPANGLDVQPLSRYVQALDDPARPALTSVWANTTELDVKGAIVANQLISVQVSYHPGWRVTANGRDAKIVRDGLGFMAIDPGCSGPCVVRLTFTGGSEWTATGIVSVCAWASVLIALTWNLRSRRRASIEERRRAA